MNIYFSYFVSLPITIRVLFIIAGMFVLFSIAIFVYVLVDRWRKNAYQQWKNKQIEHYEEQLTQLLFDDDLDYLFKDNDGISLAAFINDSVAISDDNKKEETKRLVKSLKQSNRKLLLDTILKMKRDLSGEAALKCVQLYKMLDFHSDSLAKLADYRWHKKAQGMIELSLMRIDEATTKILPYIDHKNTILRREARLALVRIDATNFTKYFTAINNPLTSWEQIKLFNILLAAPKDATPDFKTFLTNTNDSIVLFSLQMIGQLNRIDAIEDIVQLINHERNEVRLMAIKTLGKLEAIETMPMLRGIYETNEKDVKLEILNTMENIADADEIPFLIQILDEKDYDLSKAAIYAALAIGPVGVETLDRLKKNDADVFTEQLIAHCTDKRI